MNFLVDTNILSEPTKRRPDARVMAWLRENERHIYTTTISIGELRRGIERLPDGTRKTKLRRWLASLCDCMKGRILAFSTSSAHVWGQMMARCDAAGNQIPSLDSQIAAIAERHGLTVVTSNTGDFLKAGTKVLNPFQ